MLKQIHRPSPTMAISLIALFAALGGGAYAASGKIDGKSIMVKSIPGNRLKTNSVTGKQVKESTLGQVPRAKEAKSAGSAVIALDAVTAEKIIGHTLGCPDGTQPFLGGCWENSPRPTATVADANRTCYFAGGTLPGPFELVSFANHSSLTSSTDEWTDTINTVTAPGVYTVVTVSKLGEIGEASASAAREYRCVVPLLR
jgi:hypothetical protein